MTVLQEALNSDRIRTSLPRRLGVAGLVMVLAVGLTATATAAAPRPNVTSNQSATATEMAAAPSAICARNAGTYFGNGAIAQDYGPSYPNFDLFGAADFKLDTRCRVSSVELAGGGNTNETSVMTVWIHKNAAGGLPALATKCTATLASVPPTEVVTVPLMGCTLRRGRYWLEAQMSQDADRVGLWGWHTTNRASGNGDVWRDVQDAYGTGCTTWKRIDQCLSPMGTEYIFAVNR